MLPASVRNLRFGSRTVWNDEESGLSRNRTSPHHPTIPVVHLHRHYPNIAIHIALTGTVHSTCVHVACQVALPHCPPLGILPSCINVCEKNGEMSLESESESPPSEMPSCDRLIMGGLMQRIIRSEIGVRAFEKRHRPSS